MRVWGGVSCVKGIFNWSGGGMIRVDCEGDLFWVIILVLDAFFRVGILSGMKMSIRGMNWIGW